MTERTIHTRYLLLLLLPFLFFSCKKKGPGPTCVGDGNTNRPFGVKDVRLLKKDAGRPEYSPNGEWITYHKREEDGFYDIHLMRADGSDDRCLTCGQDALPGRHIGSASWHPSGDYIVFSAEKKDYYMKGPKKPLAHPGVGYNHDVWIMKRDGSSIHRLTDLETKETIGDDAPVAALLHPHFSNDGTMISWGEKIGDEGGAWGEWAIKLADFSWNSGSPELTNIQTFQPGEQDHYYESNDFLPNDEKIIICGNLKKGQPEIGMDLYEMDISTGDLERLTHSWEVWDESGHYMPGTDHLALLSTEGFEVDPEKVLWWQEGRGEFWLMHRDGEPRYPISGFNCPSAKEYIGSRVMPAYIAWHPSGDRLLAGIIIIEKKNDLLDRTKMVDELYVIELD